MRAVLSPLLTGLSGSAADVTAAKWKGRQYFRSKVIPANPQTQDQTDQRDRMSFAVKAWQSLMATTHHANIKTAINRAASAESILGYNLFTRGCIQGQKATEAFALVPDPDWTAPYDFNPAPVLDLAVSVEGDGHVVVTWTDPDIDGIVYAAVSLSMESGEFLLQSDFALTGAEETFDFLTLINDDAYNLSIIPYRTADTRIGPSADVLGTPTS